MTTSAQRNRPVERFSVPVDGAPVERPPLPDGECVLYREAFGADEREALFQTLSQDIPWERHVISLYGRPVPVPRLSAWYGDSGAVYRYSGVRLEPLPWTPPLQAIKDKVETLASARFNSALLNLYRDGQDSVGWHSDDESELGRDPVIASVSFGAVRRFILRHKKRRIQWDMDLANGSVLVMAGAIQHHWRHQLPKTRQPVGPRINLTFRWVVD